MTARLEANAVGVALEAALQDARARGLALGLPLTYAAETGSTNDDAKAAARAGAPHGALFVAGHQTSGRGRGAHRWVSPPGDNLLASLVLRPRAEGARMGELSLVAGLALAAATESLLASSAERARRVRLKWPNDVWVDERKIAGILVEGIARAGAPPVAVVGFGLNVATTTFPPELDGRATSLALAGATSRALPLVLVAVLDALAERLDRWQREGLGALRPELEARDALLGRVVRAGELEGLARGLDADGRLLLEVDGAVVPITAGEVLLA